jgi:glycosyltransferase involved in cell wall biosynthesis
MASTLNNVASSALVKIRLQRFRMLLFAIYGDEPLLPYCKHLVRELGLAERITFAALLDHADVSGVFRNARLFSAFAHRS